MYGQLNECTVAHLLQFFAIGEKSGVIDVQSDRRRVRLFVDYDRVIGIGLDDLDLRSTVLHAVGLPHATRQRVMDITPRRDTPGLSLILRNLMEPVRWDLFMRRHLEQHVYPLLSTTVGHWEVAVGRCPPAPLTLSISVNSLILDGSRWESEIDALNIEHLNPTVAVERTGAAPTEQVSLRHEEWLLWSWCSTPRHIGEVARDMACPDLAMLTAARRLLQLGLLRRAASEAGQRDALNGSASVPVDQLQEDGTHHAV